MKGKEDLKSAQRRPKRQRPRMSEDEDINFDAVFQDSAKLIKEKIVQISFISRFRKTTRL